MVSVKLLSWMCVTLSVLALVEAKPKSWIEAIEDGFVGVKDYATSKNVNDDVVIPESSPSLSTFPLQHAIRKTNNLGIVKLLLNLGANPDSADSGGDTPLLRALEVNNKMIIELLLKEGVSLDVKNNSGQTVLVKALYTGNINVLQDVLDAGKDDSKLVNLVDGNGRSIVHLAANSGNVPAVRMLLKVGVSTETMDDNGETALFQAARNGFSAIVKVLLDQEIESATVGDKKGDTPLHEAAKRGFPDIVSALLKAGADRDARNNQGESASDIACREPKKISKESCVTLIKAALKTKSNLKAKNTCSCPCKSRKSGA